MSSSRRGWKTNLATMVASDLVDKIKSVGATNFRPLVSDSDLTAAVEEYGKACTQVFVSQNAPIK